MKKKLMVFACLFCSVIMLSGCFGSKKLTCTKTEEASGMTTTTTIGVTFKNDEATKASMKFKVDLGKDSAAYIDTLKKVFDSQFSEYTKQQGVTYSSKVDGTILEANLEMDTEKMDDATKKELGVTGTGESYKDAKSSFESEGYTCK